ncbi:hypothetical protein BRADI_1g28923v3 [Brachypodium distachyon]|uniref:Uncharacterized protein n=1 Tax=Brachypodium distachyon TaxID=15368 RepID=A0A2K2DLR9_BRADI|nr:hypothetical protein BRADI_1g28923v3 [Brachypodium distachyon]
MRGRSLVRTTSARRFPPLVHSRTPSTPTCRQHQAHPIAVQVPRGATGAHEPVEAAIRARDGAAGPQPPSAHGRRRRARAGGGDKSGGGRDPKGGGEIRIGQGLVVRFVGEEEERGGLCWFLFFFAGTFFFCD